MFSHNFLFAIIFVYISQTICLNIITEDILLSRANLGPKSPFGDPFDLVQAFGNKKRNITQTLLDFKRDFYRRFKNGTGSGIRRRKVPPTTLERDSNKKISQTQNELTKEEIEFLVNYLKNSFEKDQQQQLQSQLQQQHIQSQLQLQQQQLQAQLQQQQILSQLQQQQIQSQLQQPQIQAQLQQPIQSLLQQHPIQSQLQQQPIQSQVQQQPIQSQVQQQQPIQSQLQQQPIQSQWQQQPIQSQLQHLPILSQLQQLSFPQNLYQNRPNEINSVSDISLVDLLHLKEPNLQAPSNSFTDLLTQIQQKLPPNKDVQNYEEEPYIPAIHGNSNNPSFSSVHGLNSNATADTLVIPNRLFLNEIQTDTPQGTSSLASCMEQSACILALSLLVAAGTTSAIGIPLLFGKRKRRSADKLPQSNDAAMHFINFPDKLQENNEEPTSSLFHLLSGAQSSHDHSEKWKIHQDSANFLSEKNKNSSIFSIAEKPNKVSNVQKKFASSKYKEGRNANQDNDEDNDLPTHNSKLINFDIKSATSTSDIKSRKVEKVAEEILSSLEPKKSMKDEISVDELTGKLRTQLENYFTYIENSQKHLNISSNFQNHMKTGQLSENSPNYHEENILSTLNLILNNNSESSSINSDEQIGDIFSNPTKSHYLQQLTKNLANLQKDKQPLTSNTNSNPINLPSSEDNINIHKFIQILDKLNKKPIQNNTRNREALNKLLQLALQNRLPQKVTNSPQKQVSDTISGSNSYPTKVPTKTVVNIIQNPNINQETVQSILSKLPQLITGQNPSPIRAKPSSVFSPTVILKPGSPSQTPFVQTPEIPDSNNSSSDVGLSDETKKFYTLLCQAILQPNIPLNRITAYIAEKCLVLRFTGIVPM